MQTTEHALLALGLVVLNKDHVEAGRIELALVVSFHEVAALVAIDRRLNDGHTLDGGFDKIEFAHKKSPIF